MVFMAISRRLSNKLYNSSIISSHSITEKTKIEPFARYSISIFTPQTKPENPNFNFPILTSISPNPNTIFESQALTQPKPTNSNHSFLIPHLDFATKSKNHNFISSTVEKPKFFSSPSFHREKSQSQISDLKLKMITLSKTQFNRTKPRNFSTSNPENPENPSGNPSKKPNLKKQQQEVLLAIANEARKESRNTMKNTYAFRQITGSLAFSILMLSNLFHFNSNGSGGDAIFTLNDIIGITGIGFISALASVSGREFEAFKKLQEEIKMMEDQSRLDELIEFLEVERELNIGLVSNCRLFGGFLVLCLCCLCYFFPKVLSWPLL